MNLPAIPLPQPAPDAGAPRLMLLMTRGRWIEVARIVATGLVALLYWQGLVPIQLLWAAVAVGLYPLVKTGVLDLVRERKVGTEIFVTVATLVAMFGGETVAGAVLMVIILIAEFIAELNTDRARASIKALIGSVSQFALVRGAGDERTVAIAALRIGDVVLVRPGEKIPVDGVVVGGEGSVNEAPITGESVPKDEAVGTPVFAGTVEGSRSHGPVSRQHRRRRGADSRLRESDAPLRKHEPHPPNRRHTVGLRANSEGDVNAFRFILDARNPRCPIARSETILGLWRFALGRAAR